MDHKLAKALEVEAMQNTAKAVEAIQAVLEPLQTSLENIQAQSEHIGEIPHLIRAYDDMAESLKLIAARLDAIEKNLDQMVEKIPEGRRASYTKFSPKPTEAPQIHGN